MTKSEGEKTKADLDNHSNQKNPNHEEYRGPEKSKKQ